MFEKLSQSLKKAYKGNDDCCFLNTTLLDVMNRKQKGAFSIHEKRRKLFSQFCDEWLMLQRNKLKPSTIVKYSNSIQNHIKPLLGDTDPHFLTSYIIEQFSNDLLKRKNLSPKTVRDNLSLVNNILEYVYECIPDMNPIHIVYPQNRHKEIKLLTKAEQKKLIDYLLSDMDECKFGVLLCLMTGLRIGEICALKWCDVSINEMTITVSKTMQRLQDFEKNAKTKTKVIISIPKTVNSIRIIPFSAELKYIFEHINPKRSEAYILTGSEERFMEPRTLQYRFKKYAMDCNIENTNFHVLRHTFATRCVESGFELKSLSEVLGHSSPQITLERYVHSSMEFKKENMNKVKMLNI